MGRGRSRWAWALLVSLGCPADDDKDAVGGTTSSSTGGSVTSAASAPSSSSGPGSSSATGTGSATSPGSSSTADTTGTSTGNGVTGMLEIYWVDVEGGAATVLVAPDGDVILVDAGNPGDRDADRIADVVQNEIGAAQIDLCIVTHYDGDHIGGVVDLNDRLPIAAFWDHGDPAPQCSGGCLDRHQAYLDLAGASRMVVAAGESYEVGGVTLDVVSAHGGLITEPIDAAVPNPACDGATNMPPQEDENAMSVGFVARFGVFDFLDLGDLYWFQEDQLACPENLVGVVDLYQTSHHGLASSGARQLVHGVDPLAVVMNNGPFKGGSPEAFDTAVSAPSSPELWQLHRALDNTDEQNTEDDLIANEGEGAADMAHWVRARVDASGVITMHNARNGVERTYQSR